MFLVSIIASLIFLSSCANAEPTLRLAKISPSEAAAESQFQRQLVLEQYFADDHRLQTIRFRLSRGALPFCTGQAKWKYGLAVANQYSFSPSDQSLVGEAFGFRDRLRILYVIQGSPAHEAGLRSGDYIDRVNNTVIRPGGDAKSRYLVAGDFQSGKPLNMVIDRGGLKNTTITPVRACDFKIKMTQSHQVSAMARLDGVSVNRGFRLGACARGIGRRARRCPKAPVSRRPGRVSDPPECVRKY